MNKLLHTPLTVHNVELANRLVMPPMATGKTPDGTVQDDLLAYYDARSKGGCIGLIVTEHAYISPEGKAHEGQLSVSRDTDIPGLTKLVETIHKNNTRVIAQINHAGSAAMEEITGYPAISASVTAQPEYARKSEKPVREMTADDMHTVAKKFAEAALRVKEAGFDGVEIHAAHGYLPARQQAHGCLRRRPRRAHSPAFGRHPRGARSRGRGLPRCPASRRERLHRERRDH